MDVSDVRTGQTKHKDDTGTRCQKAFQDFLINFKEDEELKYRDPVGELHKMERNSLEVCFEDIEKFSQYLSTTVIEDYYRVYPYLCQALANVVSDRQGELKKEYFVSFVDVPTKHKVRDLKGSKIGTLIRISGQVTRTHAVYPELMFGTFMCLDCRTVIENIEQQFKFTLPVICKNPVCNNRRRFELLDDKSVFVDFQKVKVQEIQAELPRGSIPRTVEVILRAEIVETVQAGDRYDFTGTLIVVPDVGMLSLPGAKAEPSSRHKGGDDVTDGVRGLKALGVRDLNYRMAFLACSVTPTNPRFFGGEFQGVTMTAELMRKQMSDAEWNKIYAMSMDKDLYKNLITSLFPSIFGSEEIKRGIVLMLFGGVPKTTIEGTTLRGDINCCIVGDPSTAKSQFLKQVANFTPRSVYTSGKASTAAGLTAAVVKDEESFDFVIEAGALLLADNGICCIDEFDKMDPRDQVAIHEAMEQQTISLAKAGVRATLNARTSILAAANPIGGRYDRAKSLQQNIALSAPIMSRFDLFFVLVDECNEVVDYAIAEKIMSLHMNVEQLADSVYTQDDVLRYINFSKQFKPIITPEAKELLVDYYDQLRQRDTLSGTRGTWRMTVRQLESMIRLSEAMAKMECLDEVQRRHVVEAYRLLNKSIIRVEQPDVDLPEDEENVDEPAIVNNPEDTNGTAVVNGERPPDHRPKKISVPYDQYKQITDCLVHLIRNEEERRNREAESSHVRFSGLKKSDVVNLYLEEISDRIDTEEQLVEKKALINKLIERLLFTDKILIPLTAPGVEDTEDSAAAERDEYDPIIIAHANYIID